MKILVRKYDGSILTIDDVASVEQVHFDICIYDEEGNSFYFPVVREEKTYYVVHTDKGLLVLEKKYFDEKKRIKKQNFNYFYEVLTSYNDKI